MSKRRKKQRQKKGNTIIIAEMRKEWTNGYWRKRKGG